MHDEELALQAVSDAQRILAADLGRISKGPRHALTNALFSTNWWKL